MPRAPLVLLLGAMLVSGEVWSEQTGCGHAVVFLDENRNGVRDDAEQPLAGVPVSDGRTIVLSSVDGRFALPEGSDPQTVFVIKPAGFSFSTRSDGLPDAWRNLRASPGPALKYGGIPVSQACADFALQRQSSAAGGRDRPLEVLVLADPQPKSAQDVGYYARDIVDSILADQATQSSSGQRGGRRIVDLGLTLGDVVNDDLSLYSAMKTETARLDTPWLNVAGNHDLDFDARHDEDSLLSYRHHFGPDTFAWEEPEANFVVLDDVIYKPENQPGSQTGYVGGLREEQFAFLRQYLAAADRNRLLVLALHIPLFEAEGRDTFRDNDRERLLALLRPFPKVLVLSAHNHTQQHVYHDARTGWHGEQPLHEYNVGAASGAFWSGVKNAQGIPDATMSDGTPNGYARLQISRDGSYALSWSSARGQGDSRIGLHVPRVLRRGAYPAFGVYANVYMAHDGTRVEYRVDGGEWTPMRKVLQPDPRLLAENARDDAAPALRGYDRSPEAKPSAHLWRGTLPTDLSAGEHAIEVRALDAPQGEARAATRYRLEDASP